MLQTDNKVEWEVEALAKYTKMLSKIPIFHREITRQVVEKEAVLKAQERGSSIVEESDIIMSFLEEVPKAFYSLMIRLMDDVGFDYKKYESSQEK